MPFVTIDQATQSGPALVNLAPGLQPIMGESIRAYPAIGGFCKCRRVVWIDGSWTPGTGLSFQVPSTRIVEVAPV